MKNQFILLLLISGITSCTPLKRNATTSATTPAQSANIHSTPVFIDNISIKPTDNNPAKHSSKQIAAPVENRPLVKGPETAVELSEPVQFKYAILLDMPVEEVKDNKIVAFIEEWYGTRYLFGGNDKNGIDCSGFVQSFMMAIYALQLPRTSAEQYQQSKRIKKTGLREGDLVFFITRGRKIGISHVGVYLRNNKFAHAATNGGVMINDLREPYYAQHYAGAGRFK